MRIRPLTFILLASMLTVLMQGCSTEPVKQQATTSAATKPGPVTAKPADKDGRQDDNAEPALRKTKATSVQPEVKVAAALHESTDMTGGMRSPMRIAALPKIPGQGQRPPAWNRESYDATRESGFIVTSHDPLSTFSIDVDTASYANIRRFLRQGIHPPTGAVRIEEMINYFHYDLPAPKDDRPFSLSTEIGPCPWNDGHRLVRIGLAAQNLRTDQRLASNLVFLVDVSGSMAGANKLGLLKSALKMLVRQLAPGDRVGIVVYAGSDRILLPSTPVSEKKTILAAIDSLGAGGSTHGSRGIISAYRLAEQGFIPGGNNRVILASDGDFNVGITSRDELEKLISKQAASGIQLTVLGFGSGNYHDDTMEILADRGNGNYAYIDNLLEAKKVLVKEMSGTLYTLARDVKIQVEFNPALVGAYRLIGYDNRLLADEEFNDDRKDAGEIGLGHQVTALYEIIAPGAQDLPGIDPLKYSRPNPDPGAGRELMTVKVRYKPLKGKTSRLMESVLTDTDQADGQTVSDDFRFAAAVAGFGLLLQDSEYRGSLTYDDVLHLARSARGNDSEGYRAEFIHLVETAQMLDSGR